MGIIKLAGCALVACVLIIVVRQYRPDMAVTAGVAAGVVLLWMILADAVPLINRILELTGKAGIPAESLECVIKAFGICVISQLAGDVCRDAGQTALASRVELGGSVAVLAVLLPLLTGVLETSAELIG